MPRPFKGTVNLDVRDSKPDWPAFLADTAPKDAPNVLVILYDDTGLAAWSPFGGRINMPTLQRIAALIDNWYIRQKAGQRQCTAEAA